MNCKCEVCGTEFNNKRQIRHCKKHRSEYLKLHHREWYMENRERLKVHNEEYRKLTKFGITTEEYNAMFDAQEGRCAICGRHQSEFQKALHIDHDHETGKIRGLLCVNCNHLLGSAYDDTEILNKSIDYLIRNKA